MTTAVPSTDTAYLEQQRAYLRTLQAAQQPQWSDPARRDVVVREIEKLEPAVGIVEVLALRKELAAVAAGQAQVLQAGDCAEPITDTGPDVVTAKARAIHAMGDAITERLGRPTVRVGRIAGQYAKPRTHERESTGGGLIPAYRGGLVNDPYPSEHARRHDVERLRRGCAAARAVHDLLRTDAGRRVWTSHEALVLDYEIPQLRAFGDGRLVLGSGHTVWVGARTNQIDHAHVALLSRIVNPVGCKISPQTDLHEIKVLADMLDPDRIPGKLMFISRMGQDIGKLPELMRCVEREGHPVIWISDPMHGNTRTAMDGRKTRYLDAIITEFAAFQEIAGSLNVHVGGLHLETTIDDVCECLRAEGDLRDGSASFTSLCDPRLTVEQALEVISTWRVGS